MAFQLAGALALKDAAHSAGISLLEPVDAVTITTSDEYVGALVSDITNRRGRITGTEPTAGGQTSISALIPQLELTRYSIDVRSLTQGTAGYNRHFHDFEPMPRSLASRVVAEQTQSS
jgi:elongation factor G